MEEPVIKQIIVALWSFCGGVIFGVFYDLMKSLRLRAQNCFFTSVCDILVCIFAFCDLGMIYFYLCRGDVRIYPLLFAGIGAMVYFKALSDAFLRIFRKFWGFVALIMHYLNIPFSVAGRFLKKVMNFLKNIFQNSKLCYTIRRYSKHRSLTGLRRDKKEHSNED